MKRGRKTSAYAMKRKKKKKGKIALVALTKKEKGIFFSISRASPGKKGTDQLR